MKLFKEIKRRAHNVALAIAGKGLEWQEKLEPVKITITPGRIETVAVEQFVGLSVVDECLKPETVLNYYRRILAERVGGELLKAGAVWEEIDPDPHELGLPGCTMRLMVKVVVPDREEGAAV